jgi:biopolymer transport protein ExbD
MHLEPPVHRSPGIGLTPLIDVVFILLVFFMLVTRFTTLQQAPLPIRSAGAAGAEQELVRVHITSADEVEVDERTLSLSGLEDWLRERAPRPLYITTADPVPLETTIEVTDRIRAAGFRDVKLALLE